MSATHERRASASGSLKERPFPRLLQQLFRKQITGCLSITDVTGDESDVYLRAGTPVHVQRPVDLDRLDRVLVEYGAVTEEAVARAVPMVAQGIRLGEALESLGVLSKEGLATVLKEQIRRKLTRLFCVADGSFAIYLGAHKFGEGDDLTAMRVDPRTLFFSAIHAAYDLQRVTHELLRLWGQQFRLAPVSPAFVAAIGIPADDPLVAALRAGWLNLQEVDSLTARPLEVRTVLLSLYYADLLERQNLDERSAPGDAASGAGSRCADSGVWSFGDSAVFEATPTVSEKSSLSTATAVGTGPTSAPRPSPPPETGPRAASARGTGPAPAPSPSPDADLRTAILRLAQKIDSLSHFELLEISESATVSEVSAAFVRGARRYHPDRLAGAGLPELIPQAERIVARMSEAAMILGDPQRRAEYLSARTGKKPLGSTLPTVIDAETTFLKGESYLKRSDYEHAIESFAAASKANPSEPQYRAYWAWARFDNPHSRKESVVREAQKIIAEAVSAQPRFARGHYWLGLIAKFLNDPGRAERAFREAVNQDKDFLDASRELRLLEMRRTRGGTTGKNGESRGGLMGRLFKK
jgi:curved DNA-binding protein CbpA